MSNLKSKIAAGEFVITAEIVPPLSAAGTKLLHEAGQLEGKVDAINLTDAAAGKTSISSFAAAAILVANGHEPILQVTCRDRNRIALCADLIGAAAQGVENLLILQIDQEMGANSAILARASAVESTCSASKPRSISRSRSSGLRLSST